MTFTITEDERDVRARRTLDAAGELLLRWGYKRVTVEDIARRAEVGKGTVYLHWKSKDELFDALLLREFAAGLSHMVAALRRQPRDALLHKTVRRLFLVTMHRPLLKAFASRDTEVLGKLAAVGSPGMRRHMERSRAANHAYLRLLSDHGLFHAEPSLEAAAYALQAATTGFFLADQLPASTLQDVCPRLKADALARIIRRSFEPIELPGPEVVVHVAGQTVELLTRLQADYDGFAV